MRVLVCTTRPSVVVAARKVVEPHVVPALGPWREEAPAFGVGVIDLRCVPVPHALDTIQDTLETHPFLKVAAILAGSTEDPTTSFRLGRLGTWMVMQGADSERTATWDALSHGATGLQMVSRFDQFIRDHVPTPLREVVDLVLPHLSAGSVKTLCVRLYKQDDRSLDGKRRALWRQCTAAGLAGPETLLKTLRTLFIRFALASGEWPLERLAHYLEFPTVAAMTKSVQRTTGYTLRQLKDQPMAALLLTSWADATAGPEPLSQ